MKRPDRTSGLFPVVFLLCVLALSCSPVRGDTQSSYFAGTIPMNGDISSFFDGSGNRLQGVCISNSTAPFIPDQPLDANGNSTLGLGKSPVGVLGSQTSQYHPSGFNPRRVIAAYNPNVNGGTIYIGIDLPGGTGSAANPDYLDPYTCGGAPPCPTSTSSPIQRGSIVPFDADGNGEAQSIGRMADDTTPLKNCSDVTAGSVVDIFTCDDAAGALGATDDPSDPEKNPGAKEDYALSISFTNGTVIGIDFYEDNTTASGQAALTIDPSTFGVFASKSTAGLVPGVPLGYDVEFAVTNINANIDVYTRLLPVVTVTSGSNRAGEAQDVDTEILRCVYNISVPPTITAITRQGNNMLITWMTTGGKTNVVQATNGGPGGTYTNNFTDLSGIIIPAGSSLASTDYLDIGGATNSPARYYRVRMVQ
jgi:hypothetical protein